jgi:hypothetical protein
MEDDKVNDILILGCCYTPESNEDYEGPYFKYNEITHDLLNTIRNKEVFIEHDLYDKETGEKRQPIGKVVDAYINSDGQVMSFLHITGDPVANSLIPHGLIKDDTGKRYYNDLSLGHGVVFDIDEEQDKINIEQKIPEEVSIVRTGDRPKTNIVDYWLLPYNSNTNEIKKMIPNLIN